jgi:TolB-like protein/tetratricopeptide (TPR) repeat protein
MSEGRLTFSSLIAELKERRVFRTVLIYVAAAWLIIQAVDIVGPALFLPAWSTTLVIVLLVLGLPFAVLLSWRFDLVGGEATRQASPEGKAATYIWLAFSVVMFIGGAWLARYTYTQTMAVEDGVHESFGEYAPPDHSIAVLPFTNMSGNPGNDYFGEGLADSVLHRLAQVEQLFVIARTSSFRFKGSDEGIETIGRKLNVGAVLEGSVQQAGNRMRIIAQLIDVQTGQHLQSLTFDASADDIFAVQDQISVQVAEALKIELLQGVTQRLTASGTDIPKAHDLYMLGRFHAGKYTPDGVRRGHEFFKQALTLDPTFVLAYVGVAETLIRSPQFEQVPGTILIGVQNEFSQQAFPALSDSERYQQAREALDTAMVLDDSSAEAHAMLGYLETWLGDRSQAEPFFQRAIELAPGLVDAHLFYGRYLAEASRYADARDSLARALELDPANIPVILWNAIFMRTDFEQQVAAIDLFERIAELDPDNEFSQYRNPSISFVGMLFNSDIGRYDRAVQWLEDELATNRDLPANVLAIGQLYFDLGDPETGERWLEHAMSDPALFSDQNGPAVAWWLLVRREKFDDAFALVDLLFGNSEDPFGYWLRGATELAQGNFGKAMESFDRIPEPVQEMVNFSFDDIVSNTPLNAGADALLRQRVGRDDQAEVLINRLEESIAFFRREGINLANLDFMDAQVHLFRGDHDAAIASLEKTAGKMYRWPLAWDPSFIALHEDSRFQAILQTNRDNLREQLELVRERHRVPPPWSPDYLATE